MITRSIVLDEDVLNEIKKIGKIDSRSTSYLVREAIDEYLEGRNEQVNKKVKFENASEGQYE